MSKQQNAETAPEYDPCWRCGWEVGHRSGCEGRSGAPEVVADHDAETEVIRLRTDLAEQTARADAAEARAEVLLVQRDAAEEQRDHATRTATALSAQIQDVYLKTCGWCGGAGHTTDEHNQVRPDDPRTPPGSAGDS